MIAWWSSRSFRTKLLLVMALGLVVRLAYNLLVMRDHPLWGDAYAYYWSGRLLAEGHGFIQPLPFLHDGTIIHSPDRPPGYFLFLAFWSLLGLKGYLTQKLLTTLMGVATIGVAGLLGRQIAGERVGLLAAFLAALYPNFWLHDGMLMSETQTIFTVTLCLYLAYRYWQQPSWTAALWLGLVGGIGALTHPDTALILALLGLSVVLLAREETWRRRLAHFAIVGVAGVAVISPWVVRNLVQFEEPVFLSTGLDITMAVTNCDETYNGYYRAFWYMECATRHEPPEGDLSEQAVFWRELALDYMREHRDEVPGIMAMRVGRMWGLYRPFQQVELNRLEGHKTWISWTGLGWFYVLTPSAAAGLVLLRRRRVPILPFVAPVLTVTLAAILTFGNTRYRAGAEITLVVGAAVAWVAAVDRFRRRQREEPPPEEERTLVDATA
jgi:4-amino-4-deoxy-L-arabinose transferase-like glycosyltransferase